MTVLVSYFHEKLLVNRCIGSSTIFHCLIHQGGNIKHESISKMSEKSMLEAIKNCLMLRAKVQIAIGLAPKNFIYLLSKTASCVGCFGKDLILKAYCRGSFARLAPKLGSCVSTYTISSKTKRKILVRTGSSIFN